MKNLNRINLEFVKRLAITMLIMTVCFSLVDLYVPLQKMLTGNAFNFCEIAGFIKLKEHLPVIIGASVAIELARSRKNKIQEPEI